MHKTVTIVVALLLNTALAEAACKQVPMPISFDSLATAYKERASAMGMLGLRQTQKGETKGIQSATSDVSLLGEEANGLLNTAIVVLTDKTKDSDFARFQAMSIFVLSKLSGITENEINREIEAAAVNNRRDHKLSLIQKSSFVAVFSGKAEEAPEYLHFLVTKCKYE